LRALSTLSIIGGAHSRASPLPPLPNLVHYRINIGNNKPLALAEVLMPGINWALLRALRPARLDYTVFRKPCPQPSFHFVSPSSIRTPPVNLRGAFSTACPISARGRLQSAWRDCAGITITIAAPFSASRAGPMFWWAHTWRSR
jgi:hypothetical protein